MAHPRVIRNTVQGTSSTMSLIDHVLNNQLPASALPPENLVLQDTSNDSSGQLYNSKTEKLDDSEEFKPSMPFYMKVPSYTSPDDECKAVQHAEDEVAKVVQGFDLTAFDWRKFQGAMFPWKPMVMSNVAMLHEMENKEETLLISPKEYREIEERLERRKREKMRQQQCACDTHWIATSSCEVHARGEAEG